MPRQVDYYFSFQSPWAYIGHGPFSDLVSTYDLKVNYKPVVLVDLFSETGGLPLMKRHPVRQRYRMVELQRWRDKRGLKFHLQPANWPFNARLADGVAIAAIEAGLDPDPYLRHAYAAVWESQLNLADADHIPVHVMLGQRLGPHRIDFESRRHHRALGLRLGRALQHVLTERQRAEQCQQAGSDCNVTLHMGPPSGTRKYTTHSWEKNCSRA